MKAIARKVADQLERIAARPEDAIFLRVDADRAIAAAEASDARIAAGRPLGPLDGVTVAVKGNLAVAGAPWTAGIAGWRGRIAERDATAVARLRATGAIILGEVNLHEGALGATTDNPTFGRCANPLGAGLTPGGSSGGSGAAVAAGMADVALGTDTMGSVRIPAAYCGVAGIKPTAGLVGRGGLAYLAPTLDSVGPLAPSVARLWPVLAAIAGPDVRDPDSLAAPAAWTEGQQPCDLSGLTFGVPRQIDDVDCEPAVLTAFALALEAARAAGAEIVTVDVAGWEPGRARRGGLLVSEAEGAVAMAALMDVEDAISAYLQGLLAYGRDAGAPRLVDAYARMRAAGAACHRALAAVDALILPTAPQRAFPHDRPAPANQADLTAIANFAGVPAVALPVPLAEGGLPGSVQLVGKPWSDGSLLAWAEHIEAELAT
ncbi:amidase [Acuticoccus sediminis]|uniref:Amidase n=1 Tax=Acuticoccus sediminis TaxID=2184697 RepID=A0A8B2NFK0_9HYPH|nr:amidase [Acuticoccus sediminis]RAH97778.1 amidase [Acuticoccus sediminis]